MGLQIGGLVPRTEVKFADLDGKVIAVDAYNAIYQFLSSIRQADGTPLQDKDGRTTSHLSGLFYRNIALLSEGIKLVYVFDGEYDALKTKTHEKRRAAKDAMEVKFRTALEEEDVDAMGKYAKGFGKVTEEVVEESKELLKAMGVAVVQAPGEGEMQCAEIVKSGKAYAVASQDYDALVVGGKRLIQNLTLARKRKIRGGNFIYIAPEIIEYEKILMELGINGDQLIALAILVGTDFNPGGVKGIGPKKALALVKQKKYPVLIFEDVVERFGDLGFDWKRIFEMFKKPNVRNVELNFGKLDEDKIKEVLVERHDFSEDRVEKQLEKLRKVKKKAGQTKLF